MAFTSANLVVVSVGALVPGATRRSNILAYATNDLETEVETASYFNAAFRLFNKGDVIMVTGDMDGTPFLIHYLVTSATGAATVVIVQADVT